MRLTRPARLRGFTIIELMIVIVIVAILATVGLPSLRDTVVSARVKTAAGDLHTALTFARSEAVKRNATVSVVPANSADWSQGFSVRQGGTVLNTYDTYPSVSFAPRSATCVTSIAAPASIDFAGSGRSASDACFLLTASGYPSIRARCVMISPSGRAAVRMDVDTNTTDGCS